MFLQDALDAYLIQLQADGRAVHTIGQYRRHVGEFVRWVGGRVEVDAIGPSDIARFMVDGATTGERSTATLNALRSSLRTYFAHLHASGVARSNPARLLRLALRAPAPPRGLSDDEVRRLLDALTLAQGLEARRDHLLVAVLLRAGLRLGSALALDRADVDLERRELRVRSAKRQQPEVVPIGCELADHIVGYVAGRPDGPLFEARDGGRLGQRQAQRRIRGWLTKAGVRHGSAHALRHSFALAVYARCGDVLLVKEALRHRSVASTLAYARPRQGELRRVLA